MCGNGGLGASGQVKMLCYTERGLSCSCKHSALALAFALILMALLTSLQNSDHAIRTGDSDFP